MIAASSPIPSFTPALKKLRSGIDKKFLIISNSELANAATNRGK
jgi:hypothetical protein